MLGEAWVLVAECWAAKRKPHEALRAYRLVVERLARTAAAEIATFEVGRLHRDRGDTAAARKEFSLYSKRYPRGTLAAEAQYAVCQLLA